ncbi:ImmA/IrrE family metallo-endopeptidase [Lysobacter enzymogenes]|nr:ImmA/IrrE family metallo-endopeptidase [Lysobacter enzymogenes]
MSGVCFEVPAIDRAKLVAIATDLRAALQIREPFFPILEVVEFAFPKLWPEFCLTVGEMAEMGDNHGLTFIDRSEIRLRVDVYHGVEKKKGRDRLTLAHEVGHFLLHNNPGYARAARNSADIPAYRSSEWQANAFAGALLMPIEFLRTATSLREVAEICGVTSDAAETQTRGLARAGLLNNSALTEIGISRKRKGDHGGSPS